MQRKEVQQYMVRLPPDVDAWIEQQAAANCRTKNAEILFRLKVAMAAPAPDSHSPMMGLRPA